MLEKLIELRERIEKCEKCQFRQEMNRKPWFFEHEELKGYYGTGKVMFVGQRPSSGTHRTLSAAL